MMFHSKCGSSVVIDVTSGYRLLASAGINSKSLTIGTVQIVTGQSAIPAKFFCPNCNTNVPNSEIVASCSYCGVKLTVDTSFIVRGSGGIYCKEHAEQFADGNTRKITPVSSVIGTITLKGG